MVKLLNECECDEWGEKVQMGWKTERRRGERDEMLWLACGSSFWWGSSSSVAHSCKDGRIYMLFFNFWKDASNTKLRSWLLPLTHVDIVFGPLFVSILFSVLFYSWKKKTRKERKFCHYYHLHVVPIPVNNNKICCKYTALIMNT